MSITGGEKLKQTLAAMQAKVSQQSGQPMVQVGFLKGSKAGPEQSADGPSIAWILEHGAPEKHIPARPFFRTMIDEKRPTWGKLMMALLKNTNYDSHKTLIGAGEKIVSQLQKSMDTWSQPPNAESTEKAKGFNKPLEWSKNLRNAVDFEVHL